MARVQRYQDLEAWQQAMILAERCYNVTASFPREEIFGLTAQLRKAAVSIPSNVAEGHSRRTRPAYVYHVSIALGSQAEVETQLELSRRLGLLSDSTFHEVDQIVRPVGRLLYGLHRALVQEPT
jgi:four helix bundle protein